VTGASEAAVAKLQALVRIPTVSDRDPTRVDGAMFERLRTSYPCSYFPATARG
jgi:hypothetical protein